MDDLTFAVAPVGDCVLCEFHQGSVTRRSTSGFQGQPTYKVGDNFASCLQPFGGMWNAVGEFLPPPLVREFRQHGFSDV